MSFEEVVGQEAAVRLLRAAVWHSRVGSGYLLFGPEGVGKAAAAVAFARSLLCREDGDACGKCPSCIRSAAGSHPGLIELVAEPGSVLKLEQIQALTQTLALRPIEGERTVAILRGAERASIEGYNALLKTLEEPPPGATIVLLTSDREALPETIRSRCQMVRFRPLARDHVVGLLTVEDEELSPEGAGRLADLAGGSVSRARRLRAMGFPDRLTEVEQSMSDPGSDPIDVASALVKILTGGPKEEVRDRTRDLLLLFMERTRQRFLSPDSPERDAARAQFCFRTLTRGLDNLKRNVSPEIALRGILVEIQPRWRPAKAT